MTYQEAMSYVNGLSRFGMQLGLERIAALLQKMGNPQNELRFVHIAGTNGKGSVSTMLSHILSHSGYRTGLFISPYVLCFRERMQINGQMISEEDFADCAAFVIRCVEALPDQAESPTQFELETAIAFEWYKRKSCDFVCLEVGLGGRFDSTNSIPPPVLQIITAIGLDHTAVLGDSIDKIAFEKAGIIKGGCTVVYPVQEEAALRVLEAKCAETGSQLLQADLSQLCILKDHWLESEFSYKGVTYHKSLPGRIQVYNCLTVLTAAQALQEQGYAICETDIRFGLEHTQFPARMELLSKRPLILLDGAHNPAGAEALADSLRDLSSRRITLMMGVLEDKDYEQIVRILGTFATHFLAVTPDSPRALPAQKLQACAAAICPQSESYEEIESGLNAALQGLGEEDVLVVCGSLYLASTVRPLLLDAIRSKGLLPLQPLSPDGKKGT